MSAGYTALAARLSIDMQYVSSHPMPTGTLAQRHLQRQTANLISPGKYEEPIRIVAYFYTP